MSMSYWSVNGIGLDISKIYPDKVINFVKNHSKDEKILNAFEIMSWDDLIDEYSEYYPNYGNYGDPGLLSIIGEIIFDETGLNISYYRSLENDNEYLLYEPSYPWQLSDADKRLNSYEDLHDIFKPYIEELGLDKDTFDFHDVQYFG